MEELYEDEFEMMLNDKPERSELGEDLIGCIQEWQEALNE